MDIHFNDALVVFERREFSQLPVALDEPERGRDDANAFSRVTGFEPLQRRNRNPHALRPGL